MKSLLSYAMARVCALSLAMFFMACEGETVDYMDVRFAVADELRSEVSRMTLSVYNAQNEEVFGPRSETITGEMFPVSVRIERNSADSFRVAAKVFDNADNDLAEIETTLTFSKDRREVLLRFGDDCTQTLTCCDGPCSDAAVDGPRLLSETVGEYTESLPTSQCQEFCRRPIQPFELNLPTRGEGSWLLLAQGQTEVSHTDPTNMRMIMTVDGEDVVTTGYAVGEADGVPLPAQWFMFHRVDASSAHNVRFIVRVAGPASEAKSYAVRGLETVAIWLPNDPRIVSSLQQASSPALDVPMNSTWSRVQSVTRADDTAEHLVFAREQGEHFSTGFANECRSARLRVGARVVPEIHPSRDGDGTDDANPSTTCAIGAAEGNNTFIALQTTDDGATVELEQRNFDDEKRARTLGSEVLLVPTDLFDEFAQLAERTPLVSLTKSSPDWVVMGSSTNARTTGTQLFIGNVFLSTLQSYTTQRDIRFSVASSVQTMTHKASYEAGPYTFFHLTAAGTSQDVSLRASTNGGDMRVSNGALYELTISD